MRFIVLPISDARIVFSEEELSHMRKNIDETEVIVHENILVNKRNNLGLTTLPSEETGQFEWTYPVYEHNSNELNSLLSSDKWNGDDNEVTKVSTQSTTTSKTTTKKVDKSYWNF